jgi:outer membrane protein TolC
MVLSFLIPHLRTIIILSMKPTIQSVTGFLLLIGTLRAQAVTLSWEDVVRYTQNSNPQLDASKKDWMATRLNENVAFAGYLPTLSASTSMTRIGALMS